MSTIYKAINEAEIQSGNPITNDLLTKVKDNFENVDERLTSLETGGGQVFPPMLLSVKGDYGSEGTLTIPATNLVKSTINFNLIITGVFLIIDQAGSAGTTEIDLKYKRAAGSYTSIFTTKPSVIYSEGSDAISSNAVVSPTHGILQAGDLLRLDITSAQKNASGLIVRIDYIKT